MELVYLWIEDYKNIQKQGFNFSPKFTCDYDEKTKELTIDENNDYIENFFGDNINVTAIVGKNGSGKSTVLETISNATSQTILIYLEDKQLYYFDLHINPIIKYLNQIIHKEYSKNNLICLNVYQRYKYSNTSHCIVVEIIQKESVKNYFKIYKILNKNLSTTKIPQFIYPEYVSIEHNKDYFQKQKQQLGIYARNSAPFNKFYAHNIERQEEGIFDAIRKYVIYILVELFKVIEYKYDYYITISKAFLDWDIDSIKYIENLIKENNKEFKFSINEYLEIMNSKLLGFKDIVNIKDVSLKDLEDNNLDKLIFKYIDFFDFNFSDKEGIRSYEHLSDGEMNLFSQFINLFMAIIENKKQELILFLDEPDNTLHPQWQKEYINLLIQFLFINFPNKDFNIIITTHSPFLLSDIPKQNIIFLDKDKTTGKCIVVDGLKDKKQTFGANIHTLLSDSFFMEDGLMGEFAKGKIDDLINYLNGSKSDIKDNDEAQKLLNIIGEPIIKNQLQRMLDSKRLKKVDKIDKIEQDIIKLQKTLEELRNDKK